ncbi:putative Zn-dependent peptidase [Povalibacter uvarum]|uniref:Putative Zn-dependent peptidase n=1 Tax=Povalibacter uvarum TaxID=732238 RepID=A0A841HKP6_9GAMM|nr:pitrilysin family protein [Povalibacter uvarum]MBB6092585.1 putative Zn-dependent peptidase [Povalibacter uvarum]
MRAPRFVKLLASLVAGVTALISMTAAAQSAGVKLPPYERVELRNGAVLLLMERHDVPLIAVNAVVRGGSAVDPQDQAGLSGLLANLLEKGAGKRDAATFADTLASVGGLLSASAGTEGIVITGSFLSRDQKLMVELLSDVLQRPQLTAAQFDSVRNRQIEFIRAAKDSELESLTPLYGKAALFPGHPYGKPAIGSEAGLAAATHDALMRHYRDQFGADRLILAVVGDFKTGAMKQSLTSALNGWRKAGAELPVITAPSKVTGRRVLLIDAPESVQSYFWAGNVGVARSYRDRAALDVVNTLFGGRFTSMLNSELRIRTGLTYGARSRFDRFTQPGPWQMSSYTQTKTTFEAIDLAFSVLDRLHNERIEPALLASGKTYVQGQFPLALETTNEWASALTDLEFYKLDRGYIDGYAASLGAVTSDDAQRMIRENFPSSDNVMLVVVGQAAVLREGLRKYGSVTEMKLSDPHFAAARR